MNPHTKRTYTSRFSAKGTGVRYGVGVKRENIKIKKTAQEMQDEIFRKMPAEKKIRLALDFSLFCLKLRNKFQHGNRKTSHRHYSNLRKP